jgi:hypothetical protein
MNSCCLLQPVANISMKAVRDEHLSVRDSP